MAEPTSDVANSQVAQSTGQRVGRVTDGASEWMPGTVPDTLRQISTALACIRRHFEASGSVEVITPVLVSATVTDPGIQSIGVTRLAAGVMPDDRLDRGLYLHTSPEFAMKRLLCGGAGDIHQICKVFRSGESGARHNPEFTMVEWYRLNRALEDLIDETVVLVRAVFDQLGEPVPSLERITWYDCIASHTNLSPSDVWDAGIAIPRIAAVLHDHGNSVPDLGDDLFAWIDLLLSMVVYPSFSDGVLTAVVEYPPQLAALAKTRQADSGVTVAERFELFYGSLELANGYHELTDADELKSRFEADLNHRRLRGLPEVAIDSRLLAAQRQGLPECSGVALGFDRLVMAASGSASIDAVIPFTAVRA